MPSGVTTQISAQPARGRLIFQPITRKWLLWSLKHYHRSLHRSALVCLNNEMFAAEKEQAKTLMYKWCRTSVTRWIMKRLGFLSAALQLRWTRVDWVMVTVHATRHRCSFCVILRLVNMILTWNKGHYRPGIKSVIMLSSPVLGRRKDQHHFTARIEFHLQK